MKITIVLTITAMGAMVVESEHAKDESCDVVQAKVGEYGDACTSEGIPREGGFTDTCGPGLICDADKTCKFALGQTCDKNRNPFGETKCAGAVYGRDTRCSKSSAWHGAGRCCISSNGVSDRGLYDPKLAPWNGQQLMGPGPGKEADERGAASEYCCEYINRNWGQPKEWGGYNYMGPQCATWSATNPGTVKQPWKKLQRAGKMVMAANKLRLARGATVACHESDAPGECRCTGTPTLEGLPCDKQDLEEECVKMDGRCGKV